MKKKTVGVVSALSLVAVMLAGCGETSSIEKIDKPKEEAKQKEAKVKKKAEQQLKVGESVKFNGMIITLNSVKTSKGNEFEKPEKGTYLLANVTVENKTDEEQIVSSLANASLKDADGYSYTNALFSDAKGSLDGQVPAGGKLRGEISFDVPKSRSYEFIYQDMFESGQAIWKFKL